MNVSLILAPARARMRLFAASVSRQALHVARHGAVAAIIGVPLMMSPAQAEDPIKVELTIANNVFSPSELKVPANKAFQLVVKNTDGSAEEIESKDLQIEKVVAAKSTITIRVKPLKPGKYGFVGEYHENTAHGVLVAE